MQITFVRLCWLITALVTVPAMFLLLFALFGMQGGSVQIAIALIALGFALVPFVFSYAVENFSKK